MIKLACRWIRRVESWFRPPYSAKQGRQDLTALLYQISPTDTPFAGRVSQDRSNAFEWPTFLQSIKQAGDEG